MPRTMRPEEIELVTFMIGLNGRLPSDTLVQDMADGGMGSIRFLSDKADRVFGLQVAEAEFTDADGTVVSVTVNTDQYGDLFELDCWKVDFSPVRRIPPQSAVRIVERRSI